MTIYRRMLMVYPEFFPTYWGMQYYLPLVKQKALMPPLGLITIAAMTPGDYEFRLIDLNCEPLKDSDLEWADMVLFSAMLPQRKTLFQAAQRCKAAGKLVVMGGPFPTACAEECRPYADVLILNEGEVTWPLFLKDLETGSFKPLYTSPDKPDVSKTPCPRFDLFEHVVLRHYSDSIFPRLPFPMRILRHHRDVWTRAAHQNTCSVDARAGCRLCDGISGSDFHRR